MTTMFDHRSSYPSSRSRHRRVPADLVVIIMWSLTGLLFGTLLAVSSYGSDLLVIQALASG